MQAPLLLLFLLLPVLFPILVLSPGLLILSVKADEFSRKDLLSEDQMEIRIALDPGSLWLDVDVLEAEGVQVVVLPAGHCGGEVVIWRREVDFRVLVSLLRSTPS
jgi:hypothetical protein